jgi:hypothetical protein
MKRLTYLLIFAFWATMMTLLWRSEWGAHRSSGSPVPVRLVWEKILTAPDASSLQILHQGTNIGYCRWTASVGQDLSAALAVSEELRPEGLVERPANYSLDVEGHVTLADFGTRVGYDLNLKLDRDENWQEFHGRLKLRPDVYEIEAVAAEQKVRIRANASAGNYNRVYTFNDLQNPQKLLREVGGPILPALLASMGLPTSTNATTRFSLAPHWEAHQDWLQAGRSRMRIYRLETRLLDRYRMRISVSPVGEILRVELPGDIVLQHETLGNFPPSP